MDNAWSCYDQVQQLRPHLKERDRFLERLKGEMDGKQKQPWAGPSINHRESFLEGMRLLTERISTPKDTNEVMVEAEDQIAEHPDKSKLGTLMEQGDHQSAFFLARRLLASGEAWAEPWLEKIQAEMK